MVTPCQCRPAGVYFCVEYKRELFVAAHYTWPVLAVNANRPTSNKATYPANYMRHSNYCILPPSASLFDSPTEFLMPIDLSAASFEDVADFLCKIPAIASDRKCRATLANQRVHLYGNDVEIQQFGSEVLQTH